MNLSTMGLYVNYLTDLILIVEEDDEKLWIDTSRYLPLVRHSAYKIQIIRLAFRMYSRMIHLPFPYEAESLRKLAFSAMRLSFILCIRHVNEADLIDTFAFSRFTSKCLEIIEALITASAQYLISILHHISIIYAELDKYLYPSCSLEPYLDGKSFHAIGFCPNIGEKKEMITFKLEQFLSICLTDEKFQTPVYLDVEVYTSAA